MKAWAYIKDRNHVSVINDGVRSSKMQKCFRLPNHGAVGCCLVYAGLFRG